MKTKKVFIYAEGACWKRQLDAGKILNYLAENGYEIIDNPEKSDIIVFVTCAFLDGKLKKSIKKVKEFQKFDAQLIVAGCLPVTGKKQLSEIFDGKTITTKDLNEEIESVFPPVNVKFKDVEDANILVEKSRKNYMEKNGEKKEGLKDKILKYLMGEDSVGYKFSKKQFHIRIAWGCTGNCSYCTIKKSTGSFRSKPLDECINELKKGLNEGYKNFILDATDVGAYGIDINSSFTDLLEKMIKIPGEFYITVREIHPKWIYKYIDDFENILKSGKILILDVAIQSVNQRILKLMTRATNVEKMRDSLLRTKKAYPKLWLTCEFIAGFPTETYEEFEQSLNFIKETNFDGGQIYAFSCQEGTESERIEPKLSEKEMAMRMQKAQNFLKEIGYIVTGIKKQQILVFRKNK